MGMEISSQRLQQADAAASARAENGVRPGEADAAAKEKFEKVMERDSGHGSGKNNMQEGESGNMPSPSALMESLFSGRMNGVQPEVVRSADAASGTQGELGELVDKLVERILVSEPGKGNPEVRIILGEGRLAGTELSLTRAADGQLFVRLSCADAASFQTAVGAQDSLKAALERSDVNVRVEVTRGGTEGGNEGDAQRRSRGLDDIPDRF